MLSEAGFDLGRCESTRRLPWGPALFALRPTKPHPALAFVKVVLKGSVLHHDLIPACPTTIEQRPACEVPKDFLQARKSDWPDASQLAS